MVYQIDLIVRVFGSVTSVSYSGVVLAESTTIYARKVNGIYEAVVMFNV